MSRGTTASIIVADESAFETSGILRSIHEANFHTIDWTSKDLVSVRLRDGGTASALFYLLWVHGSRHNYTAGIVYLALKNGGYDPNEFSTIEDSRTPVHLAAYNGDLQSLRLLHQHGGDMHSVSGPDGQTPLRVAGRKHRWMIVKYLLENGVTPTEDDIEYIRKYPPHPSRPKQVKQHERVMNLLLPK